MIAAVHHGATATAWIGQFVKYGVFGIGGIGVLMVVVLAVLHRAVTSVEVLRPGMHGVIGRFGGGKSYFLAWVAAKARKKGLEVYANIHIEGCHYWWTWADFLAIPNGAVILMDEAHLVAPVRARHLPSEVDERISQLRHHDQVLFWVTQHWTRVHPLMRKLCFTVWLGEKEAGGHRYSQFTGAIFPMDGRIQVGKRQQQRLTRMRVRRRKEIERSYDTKEDVRVTLEWAEARRPGAMVLHTRPRHARSEGGSPASGVAGP